MRATFYGFEAARKALMASQVALDVTSQNISNINTEGYTRQRADFSSISSDTGATRFAQLPGNVVAGQGVNVNGISQSRDQFLDTRYRKSYSQYGQRDAKLSVMNDIESIFDETSTDGLNARLGDFYAQLESFASNSESIEYATTFRAAAKKVTEVLNQYSEELADVKDQNIYTANIDLGQVNQCIEKVAQYNDQIKGEYTRGATPNELLDMRNLMLDKLSNLTGASYELKADGQVSVKLGDRYLLDSENKNAIDKLSLDTSGYPASAVFSDGTKAEITGGTISGYLSELNGKGTFADPGDPSDDRTMGILYFQKSIDALAAKFADNFNSLNDSTGVKMLFVGDSSGEITASNICISEEWLSDSQFITRSTTASSGEGKNDNLLKMLASMDEQKDISASFKGTFEQYVTSLIGEMAVEVEYSKDMKDSTQAVFNTIANQRESVMGVSLDEEGINMVQHQKSYNAAARILTAMDELLETLINSTGKVGR